MITLCQIKALQREFDLTFTEDFGYITLGTKHSVFDIDKGQIALVQFSYMEFKKEYNLIYLASVIHRIQDEFVILPYGYDKNPYFVGSIHAPPLSYEQLRYHLKSLFEDFDYLSLYKKTTKITKISI